MSLIDELASANVDLDDLKIGDLGMDISDLGWQQSEDGLLVEVIKEDDKYSMNSEEMEWMKTVLYSSQIIHATAVVRLYTCNPGETSWSYNGYYGGAAIVSEADLKFACAHFIRVIDLNGFNPNLSLILQQEIYPGFKYHELNPMFFAFEMSGYMAGLSFAKLEAAKVFKEKVQECLSKSATDVIEEDLDSKEKTYFIVGDKEARQADDSLSVKVARKYAGGGITDGTEVNWRKKKDLPPELAALIGEPVNSEKPQESLKINTNVIDLMQDPQVRRNTIYGDASPRIVDGISVSWTKNAQALSSDPVSPRAVSPREKKETKRMKALQLLGVKHSKK